MTTAVKEKEIIAIHEKEITVKAIRKRFPFPTSVKDNYNIMSSYCVGGAFYQTVFGDDKRFGFPGRDSLEIALHKANGKLHFDIAKRYALEIITYNDAGKFEDAWITLGEALNYGKKKE